MVYYRVKSEGKHLKADDYCRGFGLNLAHYRLLNEARKEYNSENPEHRLPLREDFEENWDTRIGHNIAGKPFHTRPHPLHKLRLLEKETGKVYVVDSVHKQHYFGYYIMLLIRAEGTNSHGTIYWENISCHDTIVKEGLKEARDRFDVIS